jgi:hypothetical protein
LRRRRKKLRMQRKSLNQLSQHLKAKILKVKMLHQRED